jgi:arginyl-tRNA synthetase
MRDIQALVEDQLRAATRAALGEAFADADPQIRPADPKFGDYQANLALGLAKQTGKKPRDLAQAIVSQLGAGSGTFQSAEVAGPGFINLTLSAQAIDEAARRVFADPKLGVVPAEHPDRVVLDYGGPNIAKEMHIGNLRSTIIGDALARVLRFAGHEVIAQNHLGDWGTQFGMLLEYLVEQGWTVEGEHSIRDLNALYQQAKARFDADADFKERARARVVALQSGDATSLAFWRKLIDESSKHMNAVFQRLGVLLRDEDIRGESFFNPFLNQVVSDLADAGQLSESDGAKVVFPAGFTSKAGTPLPLIVQKSDGGFGYAATDLAAAHFRIRELGATRVVYVVDSRQSDHFGMVFGAVRQAGWASPKVSLEHVPFGTILGEDRRPFKTRQGDLVRLSDVLDEAVSRARKQLDEKGSVPEAERDAVANAIGIGAIKYADLSSDRIKDYVFDYERMLSMDGNTAPYLQYAYARIRSIFRKGNVDPASLSGAEIQVGAGVERKLVLELLKLPRIVDQVVKSLEPHRLCTYLYEVASTLHQFHEQCPVLKAPDEATRLSRLALSELVARTLRTGLGLLGIDVVEQM